MTTFTTNGVHVEVQPEMIRQVRADAPRWAKQIVAHGGLVDGYMTEQVCVGYDAKISVEAQTGDGGVEITAESSGWGGTGQEAIENAIEGLPDWAAARARVVMKK